MKVLAIDPAFLGNTGWARFENGQLLNYGTLKPGKNGSSISWVTRHALLSWADVLVIEDTFYFQNARTLKRLEQAKAMWVVPAHDLFKMQVIEVMPQVWIRPMQRSSGGGAYRKKNIEEIKFYIRERWKVEKLRVDEVSAIGLGTYWIDQQRIEDHGKD